MADKPKEAAKPAKQPYEALFFFSFIFLVGYGFYWLIDTFHSFENFNDYMISHYGGQDGWYSQLSDGLQNAYWVYVRVATLFSAVVFLGILYAYLRHRDIRLAEKKKDKELEKGMVAKQSAGPKKATAKWQKVLAHANSTNPSEWRLSILEADVLLEELLDSMHFVGTSLGEKLKGADPASFKTLQAAWEAHKIRNAIAHEGADFLVNQREAKRVIGLFEQVFNEFDFV